MSSWCYSCLAAVLCCLSSAPGFAGESTGGPESGPGGSAPAGPTSGPTPGAPLEREEPEVRPTPEGAPSLQMSPNFVSPAMAFGGYFPVPQIEAGSVRVEPFTIRASINAALGYDDNVTLVRTNKISSMFLNVAPSIAIGLEGAAQRYYAIYRGSYSSYFSTNDNSNANHNFALAAVNEWTGRLRSLVRYEFLRGHDPAGTTATAVGTPDAWNLQTVHANVAYGAPGAPGRIEGDIGYVTRRYTTNRDVTAIRDYEQFELGGTLSYRIAPKTRALVRISHLDITHTSNPSADSTENHYSLGVTWVATAKTQGTVTAGYMTKDFTNDATPSVSSPTYGATATWSPLSYSSVTFTANRSFAEASEPGSSAIVFTMASLAWNHAWFERFRSTLGYIYGSSNHEGLSRTDTYHSLDAKVSYALQRRLRIGVQFRHDARASPDATLEYKRNLSLFTIESAL